MYRSRNAGIEVKCMVPERTKSLLAVVKELRKLKTTYFEDL